MKRPDSPLVLFLVLAALVLGSCGGGGGNVPGGMMGGGLAAAFTPANAAPGPNSISMAVGTVTGDTFQIVINITNIADFFGAAFRVAFDSATAEFLSFDGSASVLHNSPLVVDIDAEVDLANAGVVLVNATLQSTGGSPAGLPADPADQQLLILTFRATNPAAANLFTFDMAGTREVTTCVANMTCDNTVGATVTWNGGTMTAN